MRHLPRRKVLHLVLTCTKRKRLSPRPDLHLGAHAGRTIEERSRSWIAALSADQGARVRADELYAGDHWQIGRSLPALAERAGVNPTLWVCSAGYGLIRAAAEVSPYSATFSRPHADTVSFPTKGLSAAEAHRVWWHSLARWSGPESGVARRISDLAASDPEASIWIVASETYLQAIEGDLIEAAARLQDPDHLVVISASGRNRPRLAAHTLAFDRRLQGSGAPLSGAAMSLNVRVARFLLENGWEPSARALGERLRDAARHTEPRPIRVGQRVPEAQVEAFVRGALAHDPRARYTSLLRMLRDELGWSYEQKRFRALVERLRTEQQETLPQGASYACGDTPASESRAPSDGHV